VEKLLWVLLVLRLLRLAAPFVIGVLGAALVFLFFGKAIPGGWLALLLFVAVAFWLARAVKDVFSSREDDRRGRSD